VRTFFVFAIGGQTSSHVLRPLYGQMCEQISTARRILTAQTLEVAPQKLLTRMRSRQRAGEGGGG